MTDNSSPAGGWVLANGGVPNMTLANFHMPNYYVSGCQPNFVNYQYKFIPQVMLGQYYPLSGSGKCTNKLERKNLNIGKGSELSREIAETNEEKQTSAVTKERNTSTTLEGDTNEEANLLLLLRSGATKTSFSASENRDAGCKAKCTDNLKSTENFKQEKRSNNLIKTSPSMLKRTEEKSKCALTVGETKSELPKLSSKQETCQLNLNSPGLKLIRKNMISSISSILTHQIKSASSNSKYHKYHSKLRNLAESVEKILFSKAPSLEMYSDNKTLKIRVLRVARLVNRNKKKTGAQKDILRLIKKPWHCPKQDSEIRTSIHTAIVDNLALWLKPSENKAKKHLDNNITKIAHAVEQILYTVAESREDYANLGNLRARVVQASRRINKACKAKQLKNKTTGCERDSNRVCLDSKNKTRKRHNVSIDKLENPKEIKKGKRPKLGKKI